MIDQDLTIKKFFDSVYDFMSRRAAAAYDRTAAAEIAQAMTEIDRVRRNPAAYYKSGPTAWNNLFNLPPVAFMPHNSSDNRALLAFNRAVYQIDQYYVHPNGYEFEDLLKTIKTWRMLTAKGALQRMKYSFMSPQKFAENAEQNSR